MSDDSDELIWLDEVRDGPRPCPECGETMRVERWKTIEIDVCPGHGIWLDQGEMEKIVKAIKRDVGSRHRRHVREVRRKARREGKLKGATWGFWSLLGD